MEKLYACEICGKSFSKRSTVETKRIKNLSVKGSIIAPRRETSPKRLATQPSKKSERAARKIAAKRISKLVVRNARAKGILVSESIVGRYLITFAFFAV